MLSEPMSNKGITNVGRLVPAVEDTVSKASEWELHERREQEAKELGANGEKQLQFLTTRNSHGNRSN